MEKTRNRLIVLLAVVTADLLRGLSLGSGCCDEEGHRAVDKGRPMYANGFFSDLATLEPVLETVLHVVQYLIYLNLGISRS